MSNFPQAGAVAAAMMTAIAGSASAQAPTPLIGVWSGTQPDGSIGTDVYRPDGILVSTVRPASGPLAGMLIRVAMRYQVQPVGSNQFQVSVQVVDYRPRQMCAPTAAGPICQPFPQPPVPPSITVTMLDPNTIEANGVRNTRDPVAALAQADVPVQELVPTLAGGGNSGSGVPGGGAPNAGLPDLCMVGQTQCDMSGWRKYCERWPNGQANWKFHGVRCRNGYGQPEY